MERTVGHRTDLNNNQTLYTVGLKNFVITRRVFRLTTLELILIPFHFAGASAALALAYSFSKSTRVSLTCKRYGSLLTRPAIYRPLPRDYHRFLKTILADGVKGEPKVPEIFIPNGNRTKNLCVSSPMH